VHLVCGVLAGPGAGACGAAGDVELR
jgi:hypothetical protein